MKIKFLIYSGMIHARLLFVVAAHFYVVDTFSQVSSRVSDSKTGDSIPYVSIWIQGTQNGTTSATDGSFIIDAKEADSLVFSAVGYEHKVIAATDIKDSFRLSPRAVELNEVTIRPSAARFLKIGEVNHKDIENHWTPSVVWSVGRYFEYTDEIAETPFIENLSIVTSSKIKEATLKILLYELDGEGNPSGLIHDDNIIAAVKKGKQKQTVVDLSGLYLRFPQTGLLVAVEAIDLESNIYRFTKKICNKETGKCKKEEFQSLQPNWGSLPRYYDSYAWIYSNEKWVKLGDRLDEFTEEGKTHGGALAVDITLSD